MVVAISNAFVLLPLTTKPIFHRVFTAVHRLAAEMYNSVSEWALTTCEH